MISGLNVRTYYKDVKMPTVNMTWKEQEFVEDLKTGAEEGFVFQVMGPAYLFPGHRQPIIYSPHGCKNSSDTGQLIIPVIAAITFERSAPKSHVFQFPEGQKRPMVQCMLTSPQDANGKYFQLAGGTYDLPKECRKDETYGERAGAKTASVEFAMNEVKGLFLNLSFDFNEGVQFFYGGSYCIWVSYWGYCNFCTVDLRGAPDHAGLVDMKYMRQPRC